MSDKRRGELGEPGGQGAPPGGEGGRGGKGGEGLEGEQGEKGVRGPRGHSTYNGPFDFLMRNALPLVAIIAVVLHIAFGH